MSIQLNQRLSQWKVVEEDLRRREYRFHGATMSSRDCVQHSLSLVMAAMMCDDLLASATPDRYCRLVRWCYSTAAIDADVLASALKSVKSWLCNYAESDLIDYSGFKHHFRADFPFLGDLLSPIKEEVISFLRRRDALSFRVLNQFLSFSSRLTYRDTDLKEEAIVNYIDDEARLSAQSYDSGRLRLLNRIMREWLREFSYDGFTPSHGNGAVAGLHSKSIAAKYRDMQSSPSLEQFLRYYCGDDATWVPLRNPQRLDRTCQVTFVPKSTSSLRTISMEPATLMYFQQGLWKLVDRHISSHPHLRRCLRIHDQSYNKRLAGVGSADRTLATIDLSSASDSVTWELVRAVFAGTRLLPGLLATRSTHAILPDGHRIELSKFAPMGSALCFPIECLVFACICEYCARTFWGTLRQQAYSVYGDDIVVSSDLAPYVRDVLTELGFRVNSSKSFLDVRLPFRESCGGEFFRGVDVTPLRISRKFFPSDELVDKGQISPDLFASYCSLANNADKYGFRLLRAWVIQKLLLLPIQYRPIFSEDGLTGIFSSQPTNYHLKRRYKQDWQEDVVCCGSVRTKFAPPVAADEHIRLHEWLRSNSDRLVREDASIAQITDCVTILSVAHVPVG